MHCRPTLASHDFSLARFTWKGSYLITGDVLCLGGFPQDPPGPGSPSPEEAQVPRNSEKRGEEKRKGEKRREKKRKKEKRKTEKRREEKQIGKQK